MRWLLVLILCLCFLGCESTYTSNTYTYYELVHSPGQLKVGDRIKIETKDKVMLEGTIIRMNDEGLVISDEGKGNQRLLWRDIHVMHKVNTTVTKEE